eukprot:jgi/Mesvir1/1411/Mv25480-RA.1
MASVEAVVGVEVEARRPVEVAVEMACREPAARQPALMRPTAAMCICTVEGGHVLRDCLPKVEEGRFGGQGGGGDPEIVGRARKDGEESGELFKGKGETSRALGGQVRGGKTSRQLHCRGVNDRGSAGTGHLGARRVTRKTRVRYSIDWGQH